MYLPKRRKIVVPLHVGLGVSSQGGASVHPTQPPEGEAVKGTRDPLDMTCQVRESGTSDLEPLTTAVDVPEPATVSYYTVLYTRQEQYKKKQNKKYQDGLLALTSDRQATLFDMEGKVVKKCRVQAGWPLKADTVVVMGNIVAECDLPVSPDEFRSGSCFLAVGQDAPGASMAISNKPTLTLAKKTRNRTAAGLCRPCVLAGARPSACDLPRGTDVEKGVPGVILNSGQYQEGAGKLPSGQPVAPVVVDPYIAKVLRPHQAEGVRFMYECVAGLRGTGRGSCSGCILADEMGLGKTLQVIALIWTLLRQGSEGRPTIRKAVVVCPATLVHNWQKEIRKWLGDERMRAMVVTSGQEAKQKMQDFKLGAVWPVLVTSYEVLRKHASDLVGVCDLLVCDEGHRLKSCGGNQTINSLHQLNSPRRVLLTGTPLQNNMDEFYALMSFVHPDLLGPRTMFKRVFGDPITLSRDRDASKDQKALGQARAEELQKQVKDFILRRTRDLLSRHLPPLRVFTVLCRPSDLQCCLHYYRWFWWMMVLDTPHPSQRAR